MRVLGNFLAYIYIVFVFYIYVRAYMNLKHSALAGEGNESFGFGHKVFSLCKCMSVCLCMYVCLCIYV